ncbi:MAG: helix-turn-helix transcriptional regulator [Erysipelotrichaceae bacterium]|nr:helix-turn-helix transcriptional regulator [Erysipelotrichaceae bacterium]
MAKYINVGKSNIYVDNSNIDGIIYVKNLEEGSNMKLHERIKKLRTNLHLSQEYVAKILGVNRNAIVEIEAGKRKVSAEELGKLGELFKVSTDELLNGRQVEMPTTMFARKFEELDEADQKEILNLIEFKRMMKERM